MTLGHSLLSLAILPIHCLAASPLVHSPTSQITYHGTTSVPVEHFQNIRFAHSTSGTHRFAPPVPYTPEPHSAINATAPGPACPQLKPGMPPFFSEIDTISEDCLNLRIARAAGTTAQSKLPVIVWLHGGGVVKGSAYDAHTDPTQLVTLSHELGSPVLCVALNYRLSIFGFARTPELKAARALNVGMRDQRAGLEWVKANIAAFGGDAERITVFGLRAGGTFSALHLMAYGGGRGVPFEQVWTMSGPPGTALNMSSDVTEEHTFAVAGRVGCGEEGQVLECLRDVKMEVLLKAAMEYSVENHPPAGLFTFIPSVDDDMFPERPSVLYKSGRFVKNIPMVLGWTQDDGAMNAGPAHLIQDEEAMKTSIRNFAPALDDSDFDTLFRLYPVDDFNSPVSSYLRGRDANEPEVSVHYFRVSQIIRELLFTCSSIDFGFEMSKQSTNLDPGTHIYVLNQSMLTPLWKGAGMPYVGVSHGSDTNYIFNGVFPEGTVSDDDEKLSKSMAEKLIRFAATGNPKTVSEESDEYWPQASSSMEENSEMQSLYLQVLGGPLGTGAAKVSITNEAANGTDYDIVNIGDGTEQYLQGYQVGAMGSKQGRLRGDVLAQEKLLERCSFINGLAEKLGV